MARPDPTSARATVTSGVPITQALRWSAGLLLAFLLLGGIAALFANSTDLRATLSRLTLAQLAPLLTTLLVLSSCAFCLRTLRWQLYTRAQGMRVPLFDNALIYIGGFALGATPGRVGEVVRLTLLRRSFGLPYRRTAVLLIADRLNDVNTLALLMLVGVSYVLQQSALIVVALALVVAINVLLRFPAPLIRSVDALHAMSRKRLPRLAAGLRRLLRRTQSTFKLRTQLLASLLSLTAWCFECASLYVILGVLGTHIDLRAAIAIHATASLVGALSMLPGGLGGFEAACVALLVWQGVPMPQAVIATAVLRVTTFWYSLLLGAPVLAWAIVRLRRYAPAPSAMPATLPTTDHSA